MKQQQAPGWGQAIARVLAVVLVGQAVAMGLTEWLLDDLEGWAEEAADIVLAALLTGPLVWWQFGGRRMPAPASSLLRLSVVVVLAQCVAIGTTFAFSPGREGELAEEVLDLVAAALVTAPLLWFTLGAERFGVAHPDETSERIGQGQSPHRRLRWVLHGTLASLALVFVAAVTIAWHAEHERDRETQLIVMAEGLGEALHALDEALDDRNAAAAAKALERASSIGAELAALLTELPADDAEHHDADDIDAVRLWRKDFDAWQAAARGGARLEETRVRESIDVSTRLLTALRDMRSQHADEALQTLTRVGVLGVVSLLALGLGVVEPVTRRVRGVYGRLARQAADFERLALVAESTSNAVLLMDRDGKLSWANAALSRMTGRPTGPLLGLPAIEALQPEAGQRDGWAEAMGRLAAGQAQRTTIACQRAGGERLWIDADVQPRWGDAGALDGYLVVATDVTESVGQRERLRTLLQTLPAGVVELDRGARVVDSNAAAQRALGRSAEQLHGRGLSGPGWNWMSDDQRPLDAARLPTQRTLNDGLALRGAHLAVATPEGQTRWLLMNSEPMADGGALACFLDVSEQRAQRTMLRMTLDANGIGTWDWEIETGRWNWSEHACAQIGFTLAEFEPLLPHWRDRIHEDDRPRVRALIRRHYDEPRVPFDTELRIRHREGHWVWIHVAGAVVERTPLGRARRMVGIHVDISARMQQAEAARISSLTDGLTGLHNRGALIERLQRAIERRAENPASHFALMFLDLDRFKLINDTLGHSAGDEMLRVVAQRLRAELRPADEVARLESDVTAARLGGDEFVIALDGLRSPGDAGAVAERVLRACSQPCRLIGREVAMSASIGVVTSEWGHDDPAALLRDADIAMYEAKRAGRGRWVRFEPWMQDAIEHRSELEADLRLAIQRGAIGVEYQPVMDVRQGRMRCLMLEALARWRHPQRGAVPAAQFIPVAEDCGLIHELGLQVLDQACAAQARWIVSLGEAAPALVSVNVSVAQLREQGFVQQVDATLKRHGLPAPALQLEITESMAAQDEAVMRRLQALKALGIRIALDDFGTGYSSLACLHQLPIDTVKIDRSFVVDIEHSAYHRTLIEATVRVAHALRLTCVAEGVETQGQLAVTAALACDAVQGHLISRSLDAAQIASWLAHWQDRVAEQLADPVTVPGLDLDPMSRRWLN